MIKIKTPSDVSPHEDPVARLKLWPQKDFPGVGSFYSEVPLPPKAGWQGTESA